MNTTAQGITGPPDSIRLGVIGVILKFLPWLLFLFESVRHPNYWESFSWLPEKLENAFVVIVLAMILAGFVFGYLCVERYVVAYLRYRKGNGLKPRFLSLILGSACILSEPIGLLLIHLTEAMRRHA